MLQKYLAASGDSPVGYSRTSGQSSVIGAVEGILLQLAPFYLSEERQVTVLAMEVTTPKFNLISILAGIYLSPLKRSVMMHSCKRSCPPNRLDQQDGMLYQL